MAGVVVPTVTSIAAHSASIRCSMFIFNFLSKPEVRMLLSVSAPAYVPEPEWHLNHESSVQGNLLDPTTAIRLLQ